ncbi:hypothetical protein PSN45_004603 [Yamadazyma tenuis]|uniref:Amino acid permease/ SLC12A domain-containing protein n=1 Tax=Candida tenuis (strain ATCC 10573 / BCRC 21748 / CBS 615 / JCM 9827 / NBRC 10315 / NRRL Y-1498 / VKM Y-70) TaxID=590646 RepID=G3B537_CANTC|nr:uncharacterized protein CANTEDRAFT_134962 [Yamadazyma tenuis ATCC 10573]EGV63128.1 hypothetical protein CANTEDRAFT_134962 [Yamadazyma tenuis ATCC 10573]WEJ97056.1 hypothetical protein PSN45_004603 [Yamadazyma tenuis]
MDIKNVDTPQAHEMSPYHSGDSEYISENGSLTSTSSLQSEYEPNPVKRFFNSFKPYDYSKIDFLLYQDDDLESGGSYDFGPQGSPPATGPSRSPNQEEKKKKSKRLHPQFDYSRLSDLERAAIVTSTSPLSRTLKSRHLSMIALGGAIGTGLFVGMGSALASAGPFGLLIVWVFIGSAIFVTASALSELAVAFPISGAFVTFNTLFIDSSWGFAMAWNYALQWLVTFPLELVSASITIQYWNSPVPPEVFVAIFWFIICAINLFGVRGYGEAECVFSMIKIVAILGFLILSVVLVAGGAPPNHDFIGGKNWHQPVGGMFNTTEPFKNMCAVIFNAAFSFAGVELFGLAAAESANPKKSIPKARKQVFWRLLFFYISSVIMIGLLVSYKNPALLGQTDTNAEVKEKGIDANTSPFVIAVKQAEIPAIPSILNAIIIITVLSVGNSSVYGSSRTMAALGAMKQGPQILNYIDRNGRPIVALLVQFVIGLLAFLVALPGDKTTQVFDWLLAISGLCSLFTWWSICLSHIRFRAALNHQARVAEEELVFTTSVWGSYYGMVILTIFLGLQFWAALFPPGEGGADVEGFFMVYLGGVIVFVCYVGHKIYAALYMGIPLTKFYLKASEIDVDTGRRQVDMEALRQEIADERALYESKPFYFKIYTIFC